MKKLFKWLFRIVLTLVILLVLAAVILPFVIDPNDYKQEIEGKIYDKIGRQVHLQGDIGWKVFPWLALTFNDVQVENEKGFKDKNMMDIKQVSARVKIMPLISKKIEIGKVNLQDAKFNLQISKKGNSNWQSILHKLESKADKVAQSKDKPSSSEINIEGVELNDIQVNYTDLQSNTRLNVTNLNLSVGKINKKDPVKVASKMHLAMPDSGLDVDLIADIKANNLLADAGIQVDIDNLSIVGKMNNKTTPVSVNLQKPGSIDLGKDTLSLPEILLAIGDVKITTNLSAKDFSKTNSQLAGTYQISAFDLNEFLEKMTGAYFVTNDTLSDFSSSGSWTMSGS
ncbi:MAG TPA: AsmA family protein, partial [Oceanospirillales bacterium]|nr:AsmA family protein [Oceanospirillales bacterium]